MFHKALFFLISLFLTSPLLLAQEVPLEETPRHLDFDRRDAVLSRIEITPFGGDYVGDTLQHSFIVGSHFDFRVTPKWSLGSDFGWSRISVDPRSDFGTTVVNKNLYLMNGVVTYNLPGAYNSKNKITEVDFYTNCGGGVMVINQSTRGTGFIGGGMKLYTRWSWLGFRIDVRNYFMTLPTPSGSDFTFDVMIMGGPTFQLPPHF